MENKDKKTPGISDTATNVANAIGTRLSADIPKPEVPEAPIPNVKVPIDHADLYRKASDIDTSVGKPTESKVKADTAKMESAMKERQAELKAKTEEEQEAKHRKAEKMWSAIGDGISAIANMATVGTGADSMYNPADSLHSKVKSKWDEIKANKAAVAAANRKAQMDLLLKDLELGARAKEAEANRNFNVWKVGTEEEGKNQRAKDRQAFDAEQNELNRKARIEAAKKGRSVNVSSKSSASDYSAVGPDGKVVKWKEKSQAAAELRKWIRGTGNEDAIALLEDRPYERSLTYDELYDIWEQYKK